MLSGGVDDVIGAMGRPLLAAVASMLGLALVMPPMTDLQAAELRVLAGGSMTGPLNELAPQFERATGHKLVIHFDSTPNLIKQITSARRSISPSCRSMSSRTPPRRPASSAGPTIDIARVGYGVIVRAGAPKPDIGTPEALKKTLLDAHRSPSCRRARPAPMS